MAKRPAEELVAQIGLVIKIDEATGWHNNYRTIRVSTLKRWRALAKLVDARFRLDGSLRSKRKVAST